MTVGAPRSLSVPEHPLWLADLGLSTYVAIDLETTGLDADKDQIIEMAAVSFVNGQAVESFQSLVRVDRPLDPFITELTGITDVDLKPAPQFSEIAGELLSFIGEQPIVGQAVDFDLAFLRSAGQQRAGTTNSLLFSHAPVLDTSLLARVFWPELPSFGLRSLAAHFDVTQSRHHRAGDDALVAGTLLREMVERLPDRTWSDLARDLYRLIGTTTHRSRFFFAALAGLAKDAPKLPVRSAERGEAKCEPITESIQDLLGTGGRFETALEFFKARPIQVNMSEAVIRAFEDEDILLVEAPTGVGKSLAYLVPALRWALEEPDGGRQVMVSSHTKMLQEQLHRKDIGEVRLAINKPFRSAVLKGRNNYLCKRRLRLLLREAGERLSELDRIQLMPLLRWSETTATGDVSEIGAFNSRTQSFLWSQISSDSLACAGGACSAGKGDFHRLAQERAAKAQLVFVNHALLFSDLARLTAVPADNRRFVLDEAHQIEKAAVSAMSAELSPLIFRNALAPVVDERSSRGILSSLIRLHKDVLTDDMRRLADDLMERARSLYPAVRQHFSLLGEKVMAGQQADARRSPKIRFRPGDMWQRETARSLNPLSLQWLEFSNRFNVLIDQVADLRGEERLSPELLTELRSSSDKMRQLNENFDRILNDEDLNLVKWLEAGYVDYGAWCGIFMAPVSVGGLMKEAFWNAIGSAVLTSATLSTSGNFSLIRSSLGLTDLEDGEIRELTLDSPFDLPRQMQMIVPMFLPDPRGNDSRFVQELGDLVAAIIEQTRRATVILCTSNDMVDRLTTALTPVAQRVKRPLFSQAKSSSTPELLAEYRKHRDGILIGAATFWEGIDLVGDALELLIVSKIPFDVPTDPWVAARCEMLQREGHDAFAEFSVPVATLRMKQGIGRLIRHQTDRGVAILADPRLFTARYGQVIRQALPGSTMISRTREEVLTNIRQFFDGPNHD
jgi:predicted DnaQ family exonuclease/DinG family helicase